MKIQLFNFLEDNNAKIIVSVKKRVVKERPAFKEFSDGTLKSLIEQYLDGYIDLLVTGQTDWIDRVFRLMSRVLVTRGSQLTDLFELPLIMESVIRDLLAEEYSDSPAEEALKKFNTALEETETTSHKSASRFLDIFQELLDKRVDDHNNYLNRMQREFDIDLTEFRIVPEDGESAVGP